MSIQNVGGNRPVQNVTYTRPTSKPAETTSSSPARGSDKLELSGMSHLLQSLKTGGDVRADKVAALKAQIEAGTYETDEKLDIAADKLLDELNK